MSGAGMDVGWEHLTNSSQSNWRDKGPASRFAFAGGR